MSRLNRSIRRCALQALYQFDSGSAEAPETVRATLEEHVPGSAETRDRGFELATMVWEFRSDADRVIGALTPEWPIYRQPVLDRNILRMAHYEMMQTETPPKVAINEAVELAREFSTQKSSLFINGVLDRILKSMRDSGLRQEDDASGPTSEPASDPAPSEHAEGAE